MTEAAAGPGLKHLVFGYIGKGHREILGFLLVIWDILHNQQPLVPSSSNIRFRVTWWSIMSPRTAKSIIAKDVKLKRNLCADVKNVF